MNDIAQDPLLTEAEMIAQSLEALEAYKHTKQGISHERFQEWLDRLGQENSKLSNPDKGETKPSTI